MKLITSINPIIFKLRSDLVINIDESGVTVTEEDAEILRVRLGSQVNITETDGDPIEWNRPQVPVEVATLPVEDDAPTQGDPLSLDPEEDAPVDESPDSPIEN